MAKETLTLTLRLDGARATLAALREMPKEASQQLRDASQELSETLADRIRSAARREGAQAALLARTVKARRDRVPMVVAGGKSPKLGRHGAFPYQLLFASEFGMDKRSGWYAKPRYADETGTQYRPHSGQDGYWFFPTARANEDEINERWGRAADEVLRAFGGGG